MSREFKYDAFISYRHTELDKFVAENLHKQLEAFSLPKGITNQCRGQKNKIERVFRDKEELPLSSNLEDPIIQALESSEWLIVICSPRLKESLWCKKEIETFIALRGREHVLAVLIEGEPADSFPDELLYKVEKFSNPDGSMQERKIPVEPLAADLRGNTHKDMLRAMKTENLRLLATMFGVTYDDLRQRHKERRMKRIMTASLIGGLLCLFFGIYSTVTALRIQNQKEQIEAQSIEIKSQAEEIQQKSNVIYEQSLVVQKQNDELTLRHAISLADQARISYEKGDRIGALRTSLEALTQSEGITMPYTPQAQVVLADSLRAYDTGNIYKADYQYETAGRIQYISTSMDARFLVLHDEANTLTLFDLEEKKAIHTITSIEGNFSSDNRYTFLGEERFAYINHDGSVCIYDIPQGKVTHEFTPKVASQIAADVEGNYIAVKHWDNTFTIYDGYTYEELGDTPQMPFDVFFSGPFLFSEGIFACAYPQTNDAGMDEYTLYFVDLKTMEVISTFFLGNREIKGLKIRNGVAYAALAEYDTFHFACDSWLSAIDIETGNLLWENELRGLWEPKLLLPGMENGTNLIFTASGNISLYNMQTGECTFSKQLETDVLHMNSYLDNNNFLLLCENGEMIVMSEEYGADLDLSAKFECMSVFNQEIIFCGQELVVLEKNDNKITVYTMRKAPNVQELDHEWASAWESTWILGEEAAQIAKTYGLENPEYVHSLFYDTEEKVCFVQYWDNRLVVYDVQAQIVKNTLEDMYYTRCCLGTDASGYTYLIGSYGAYMLNEAFEPVMWLDYAVDVDLERQVVYLNWTSNYYEAPIYSARELIQMAKEELK